MGDRQLARLPRWTALAIVSITLLACAPSPSAPPSTSGATGSGSGAQPTSPPAAGKTLVWVDRAEPGSLTGTSMISVGISTGTQVRLFNAALTMRNNEFTPIPYLAEALPQLNTDSWKVSADGRMETTYRLRANLTWHDGAPLTANDFVFAYRVYSTPDLGIASKSPISVMEDVSAPDPRTVLIRWKRLFPDAGSLEGMDAKTSGTPFTPLPRHILEPLYEQDHGEAFLAQPFWTSQYVGAGPYKLDRWEPGAFIEAAAFDGHILGRPKINRIRMLFNADPNTVLAQLLSGEAHMPIDDSIRIQQGLILKRDWAARNSGSVQYRPTLWRVIQVQHRPEYANPKAVLDVRVRRALAHAIDKNAINESLFEGEGIMADTLITPTAEYFRLVDQAVAKYPYDLRRADQLMTEGGYSKGPDGAYVSPTEGRLNFELKVIASAQNDAERTIMADGFRRSGFDMEEGGFTPVQSRDGQALGTFRSLSTTSATGGEDALVNYTTNAVSRPENRWTTINRGGWSNAEYDRAVELFETTLDRNQRMQHIVQAARIFGEQLGGISLYFNPSVLAYPTGVTGVNVKSADTEMSWNIHEWEFR
jgi:peptide/nickel transport system substrate-binding protein